MRQQQGSQEFLSFFASSHLSPSSPHRVLSLSHLCCIHDATEDNCSFTWRFIESSAEKKDMADEGGDEGGLSFPSIGITLFPFLSLSLYLLLCVDLVHLCEGSKAWCCINGTSHVDSCLAIPGTLCVSGSESGCCSMESNV